MFHWKKMTFIGKNDHLVNSNVDCSLVELLQIIRFVHH